MKMRDFQFKVNTDYFPKLVEISKIKSWCSHRSMPFINLGGILFFSTKRDAELFRQDFNLWE